MKPVARAVFLLVLAGCTHQFPEVYGVDQLRLDSEEYAGRALVHYLSRRGADPSVCEPQTLTRVDEALVDPFVEALARKEAPLPPGPWQACAVRLEGWLPAPLRERLAADLSAVVLRLAKAGAQPRLAAVRAVLLERRREPSESLQALNAALATLHAAPAAVAEVQALRELLDLDLGRLAGQPLTEQRVTALDDEALLLRIEARAPTEPVRTAARRRVVRLHLARATLREVQEHLAEVEAAVFATGRWAQPVASLAPPVPQPALAVPVELRFSQDLAAQLAFPFVADGVDRRAPEVDLRPLLRFHVGWSEPLPLCDPPAALSVMPCVDPLEVQLGSGFASLDADGVLHVLPKWAMEDAVDLTRAGLGLVVPLLLAGRPAQVLQLPLSAQPPDSFCFEGPPSERGPAVNALVEPTAQALLVEAVEERGGRVRFVLPRHTLGFEFGSCGGRGVQGSRGTAGANGASGSQGHAASCPSSPGGNGGAGGNGYAGGPGGPGGPGGDGGPVRVEYVCGGDCADEALVRAVFQSRGGQGGAGGPGGPGGQGGAGGMGGSSTSCYQDGKSSFASGGSQGPRGANGPQGPPGPPGPPGHDGDVQLVVR